MIFLIAHLQESDFLTTDNSSLETNDYYMVSLPDCLALRQLLLNGFYSQIIRCYPSSRIYLLLLVLFPTHPAWTLIISLLSHEVFLITLHGMMISLELHPSSYYCYHISHHPITIHLFFSFICSILSPSWYFLWNKYCHFLCVSKWHLPQWKARPAEKCYYIIV